jgi:hypothetical protein
LARLGTERDKDIHVEGDDRLQVKGRSNRPVNRIAANDAVGLHPVGDRNGFLDVHGGRESGGKSLIQVVKNGEELVSEKLMGFPEATALRKWSKAKAVGGRCSGCRRAPELPSGY